jgi:hypothetical protein
MPIRPHRPLLPAVLVLLLTMTPLVACPVHATMFLANTTANIKSFSKLLTFCQSVNPQATVVAMNVAATKSEANALMDSASEGKMYVSATYDVSASPPGYYWVVTTNNVASEVAVSPGDFVQGVTPPDQLFFVLYSTSGLEPYTGVYNYPVLCTTDDPAFTTLPPTTTTTTTTPITTTTTAPPNNKKKSSSFPWWAILILVLGIVVIIVVVLVVMFCCFECVTEDDLAANAEEDDARSDTRENPSFDHRSQSEQSKSASRGRAEATTEDTNTYYTESDSCSRSTEATSTSAFTDDETQSSYSRSEVSPSRSSGSDNSH